MLLAATEMALGLSRTPSYVVLLGDGEDTSSGDRDARAEALLDTIRASGSTVLPFGIGEADDSLFRRMALASGTQYTAVPDASALPALYRRLGDVLGGRVTISWRAPAAPAGTNRDVTVRLEGFPGAARGSYVVLARSTFSPPRSRGSTSS